MGRIIFFMSLELSRSIGHYSVFLHKDTTQTDARSIAINIKALGNIWLSKNMSGSETILKGLKRFFTGWEPLKLNPILQ
jgi:hypothetical protein